MDDPTDGLSARIPSRLVDLIPAERVLLGASRVWVQAWLNGGNALQSVQQFFKFYELQPAAKSHSELMHGVFVVAERPIEINAPTCLAFTRDEAQIVHAVACAQSGRQDAAQRILETWQTPSAARLSAPTLWALGAKLAELEVWAPLRPWRTEPPVPSKRPVGPAFTPSSQRLH